MAIQASSGRIFVGGRSYRHTSDGDVNQAIVYRVDAGGLIWSGALGDVRGSPDEWATDVAVRSAGDLVISARMMAL